MKFGNINIGGMSFGSTRIGGAKYGNTLVFKKGNPLPPYDSQVEYIEGNGTQYINTGQYVSFGHTSVVIDCQYIDNLSSVQILVGHGDASGKWFGNHSSYFAVGSNNYSKLPIQSSIRSQITVLYKTNKRTELHCGSDSAYITTTTAITNTTPITIFSGNSSFFSYARVYSCKVYDGDTLVQDLIPVRVGSVGCMYDNVSGDIFSNVGSGDFVVGQDV